MTLLTPCVAAMRNRAVVPASAAPRIGGNARSHQGSAAIESTTLSRPRDPLFREVFANADKIVMTHETTPRGIKVVETSADAYTVKLIQAHANVLDLFIRNGHAEVMKNHEATARPQ